ncbi:MAG: hypothetical protein Fur0037_28190 [Planctomycetota bacterium]
MVLLALEQSKPCDSDQAIAAASNYSNGKAFATDGGRPRAVAGHLAAVRRGGLAGVFEAQRGGGDGRRPARFQIGSRTRKDGESRAARVWIL